MKRIQVSLARPPKCKQLRNRSLSCDSTQSDANSGSPPALINPLGAHQYYPIVQREDQVRHEMKYYQDLWATQNQMVPQQLSSPFKYDNVVIDDKNNMNFFVVWVPVVWLPHNHNKDMSIDDSYRLV